ncbi:MAG: hypothetical protein ACRD3W_10085, partial [Terriglobales bacterium]
MNFVSTTFLLFLIAVWLLFMASGSKARINLLTLASYIFYATWSIPFISIILITTTVDYVASKIIARNEHRASLKKIALATAIGINLLV